MTRILKFSIGVPFLALFLVTGRATEIVGAQGSPVQAKRATELIMAMDASKDPQCGHRTIVKKTFVEVYKHAPGDHDEIERWTIDRCGKLVNYFVTLTTVPRGEKLLQVELERDER